MCEIRRVQLGNGTSSALFCMNSPAGFVSYSHAKRNSIVRRVYLQDWARIQNILNQERPDLSSVSLDFRIDTGFSGFAPGFIFRVGAAGKMAEVRPVGTDPNTVSKSAWRQVCTHPLIDDFDQGRDILDVVSWYAAADCKNPKTLGRCH